VAPTLFCVVPGLDCRVFGLLEQSWQKEKLSVDPDVAV
jgi:hypothetical protein